LNREFFCSKNITLSADSRFRNNPTFHLNYSLALYKAGNRRAASQQFKLFEQNFKAQQGEVDPEVSSWPSKLGIGLHGVPLFLDIVFEFSIGSCSSSGRGFGVEGNIW
jgi:hypothetical protein